MKYQRKYRHESNKRRYPRPILPREAQVIRDQYGDDIAEAIERELKREYGGTPPNHATGYPRAEECHE